MFDPPKVVNALETNYKQPQPEKNHKLQLLFQGCNINTTLFYVHVAFDLDPVLRATAAFFSEK